MKRIALILGILIAFAAPAAARTMQEVRCPDYGSCKTVTVPYKNYGKHLRAADGKRVRVAKSHQRVVARERNPLLEICTLPVNYGKLAVEKVQLAVLMGVTTALTRAEQTFHFFVDAGYNTFAAAGIVGHLKAESNFSIKATGDRGKARGIAQWHPDRFKRLKAWAGKNGKDWHSYRTQMEYIDVELREREKLAYVKLQQARSVKEATAAFMHFERPQGYTPDRPQRGHSYNKRYLYAAATHERFARDMSAAAHRIVTDGAGIVTPEGWNIHKSVAPATLLLGFAVFLGAGAIWRK